MLLVCVACSLLVAVEKGRYETLTQGMEHTISIFIDAALKLVKKCDYQVRSKQ